MNLGGRRAEAMTTYVEMDDPEFSQTFADELAPILNSLGLGRVEVRDKQIVVLASLTQLVYIDVRAVQLTDQVRLRRPLKRTRRGKLRLVQG